MSEELAAIVYFQIYAPFAFALSLVSGFFWNRHLSTKRAITKIDDKVNEHITEFTLFRSEQINQTSVLKEINENVASNNIIVARLDERIQATVRQVDVIAETMERRSEVRSNNTPL
jgi:hypothetical protein